VAHVPVRAVVERGPKNKRSVAFSLDWPGWSRGAKTAELALASLEAYRVRYRPIGAASLLRRNLAIYGLGGLVVPFVGIKLIDWVLVAVGLV